MRFSQLILTALQALLRSPRFSISALATLTLGISALTLVVALAYSILTAPLPIPESQQVVSITRLGKSDANLSLPDAITLRPNLSEFEAISAIDVDFALDWLTTDGPQRLRGSLIEADFFRVLGIAPLHGRLTRSSDDLPGAAPVVVLRESFWRRAFDADPAAIGRMLTVSGVRTEIIGVIADESDIYEVSVDLYAPFPPFVPWALSSPGSNTFEMIGRIAHGSSLTAARAQLQAISADYAKANGNEKHLDATSFVELLTAPVRPALQVLLVAVGLMLLLVMANVVALLRVHFSRRESEWATRAALGASDGTLHAQRIVEVCWLTLGASICGAAIASILFAFAQLALSPALPRLAQSSFPTWILLALPLLALLLGLAVGTVSAHSSSSVRSGVAGSRRHVRALHRLMVAEVAVAGALLGAALLLAQSFVALSALPLGFEPAQVIGATIVLPEREFSAKDRQSRAFSTMVETLQNSPGIRHAALVVGPPLVSNRISHTLIFENGEQGSATFRPIIGDYFAALGVQVLAGQGSNGTDANGERIAWINQSFANAFFKDISPLGERVSIPPGEAGPGNEPRWMRIVGIVADVRGGGIRNDEGPALYAPYLQREADWIRFGTLVARTNGDMANFREVLQDAASTGAPNVPIAEAITMQAMTDHAFAQDRLILQLVAAFAALAVFLALQGVFGVVSFAIRQRRAELGLRMALGAAPAQASGLLLSESSRAIALGCVLAPGLLFLAEDVLSSVLFGISATDPPTLAAALAMIAAAALLAVWWPSRRAAKLDAAALLLH